LLSGHEKSLVTGQGFFHGSCSVKGLTKGLKKSVTLTPFCTYRSSGRKEKRLSLNKSWNPTPPPTPRIALSSLSDLMGKDRACLRFEENGLSLGNSKKAGKSCHHEELFFHKN
jgi:hypothetical protein